MPCGSLGLGLPAPFNFLGRVGQYRNGMTPVYASVHCGYREAVEENHECRDFSFSKLFAIWNTSRRAVKKSHLRINMQDCLLRYLNCIYNPRIVFSPSVSFLPPLRISISASLFLSANVAYKMPNRTGAPKLWVRCPLTAAHPRQR